MHPSSPQAQEMADESMVRNLAAQAEAIWPQEEPIFDRHPVGNGSVLDVGCGTAEITERLAAKYPQATLVGIDLEEQHLDRSRARCAKFGSRVRFELGDALAIPFPDAQFDLVVCRHLLQAIPPRYSAAIGTDLHVGRKMFTMLHDLKMSEIAVDYIVVDTLRVPRETFARIWEAWRDGFIDPIVQHAGVSREEAERRFREMIDCARDPRGYALWQVPLWTAGKL